MPLGVDCQATSNAFFAARNNSKHSLGAISNKPRRNNEEIRGSQIRLILRKRYKV